MNSQNLDDQPPTTGIRARLSPRLFCNESTPHGAQGGTCIAPYKRSVFEANEKDVPETPFDLILSNMWLLRINQIWYCHEGASKG